MSDQSTIRLGTRVRIRDGATAFLRENGLYTGGMPSDGIDGLTGSVVTDYSDLHGAESHYGVMIGYAKVVGVHPDHIEAC